MENRQPTINQLFIMNNKEATEGQNIILSDANNEMMNLYENSKLQCTLYKAVRRTSSPSLSLPGCS
jgi:hypothetical protein